MSDFTEEIPGQIAAIIKRLGDGRYTYMSIYPLPADAGIYDVCPTEVLTATDAIELFQHYYEAHSVPAGWSLREQPEFSDTTVAEQHGEGERCSTETKVP